VFCGRSGPHTGGLDPILGVRSVHVGVLDQLGGPNCISRGPALSHGGPDPPLMPWSISLSLDTWRPRSHPRGGVRLGRVMAWSHVQLLYHATKDSRVGTASSCSNKGYPSLRVSTVVELIYLPIDTLGGYFDTPATTGRDGSSTTASTSRS
jgi:hypothetical protein